MFFLHFAFLLIAVSNTFVFIATAISSRAAFVSLESRVCMCYDVSVSLRSSLFFLTYHKHRIRCIFKFFRKKFSAQIKKYRSHMRKRYFSLLRQAFILFISLILEVKNKLCLTIFFFRWHCILFQSTQHYLHYRGFRGAPL